MLEKRFTFNEVAELYDSVRPTYPSLLYKDLLLISKAESNATILDIGCGTGKSSDPLVKLQYQVYALDLGDQMIGLCKRNFANYPNVEFVNSSFETWNSGDLKFDLVISGTAFHWLEAASYQKISRILKPEGFVGIFWYSFLKEKDSIYDEISEIYKRHAPGLYKGDTQSGNEQFDKEHEDRVLSIPGIKDWRVIRYYKSFKYSTQKYLDLLSTWSSHTELTEAFFDALESTINNAGGEIDVPIRVNLCLGQRE